jgi:tetratricopeptide (TPR) repeat protein
MGANLVARVMLDRGDIDSATAVLKTAMEQTPEEGLYAEVLARSLIRSGQMDEAIALLENAITKPCMQQSEVRQKQYLALASALIQSDRPVEAQQALQHVNMHDRRSRLHDVIGQLFPESRLVQGEVHLALGELDQAQEVLEFVLRRNPGLNEVMIMLEKIYQEQGQVERAVPLRQELLFRRRRVAEFYQYAKLQKQMGQHNQMESLFHTALEGVPLTDNYERLYQAATAHGVQVVAVQYPTFSLDLLRLYAPDHDDLRLVDTEHIFDNLPPESVFVEPRFPYNFAHYTHEGARLLAERIASEVLDRPQSTP